MQNVSNHQKNRGQILRVGMSVIRLLKKKNKKTKEHTPTHHKHGVCYLDNLTYLTYFALVFLCDLHYIDCMFCVLYTVKRTLTVCIYCAVLLS